MSSMFLLKDHGDDKKGAVVSRPFHVGKALIKAGVARYATEPETAGVPAQDAAPTFPAAMAPIGSAPDAKAKK